MGKKIKKTTPLDDNEFLALFLALNNDKLGVSTWADNLIRLLTIAPLNRKASLLSTIYSKKGGSLFVRNLHALLQLPKHRCRVKELTGLGVDFSQIHGTNNLAILYASYKNYKALEDLFRTSYDDNGSLGIFDIFFQQAENSLGVLDYIARPINDIAENHDEGMLRIKTYMLYCQVLLKHAVECGSDCLTRINAAHEIINKSISNQVILDQDKKFLLEEIVFLVDDARSTFKKISEQEMLESVSSREPAKFADNNIKLSHDDSVAAHFEGRSKANNTSFHQEGESEQNIKKPPYFKRWTTQEAFTKLNRYWVESCMTDVCATNSVYGDTVVHAMARENMLITEELSADDERALFALNKQGLSVIHVALLYVNDRSFMRDMCQRYPRLLLISARNGSFDGLPIHFACRIGIKSGLQTLLSIARNLTQLTEEGIPILQAMLTATNSKNQTALEFAQTLPGFVTDHELIELLEAEYLELKLMSNTRPTIESSASLFQPSSDIQTKRWAAVGRP